MAVNEVKEREQAPAPQCVAEVDLAIMGMTCASCVARVEKKLNKVPGVSAVVNLATEKAHVQLAPEAGTVTNEDLIAVVEKAGYGANLLRRVAINEAGEREAVSAGMAEAAQAAEAAAKAANAARVQDLWQRFWVSLVLSLPVVLVSMVPALQFPAWQWVIGALALVIAVYCGWPFHKTAFRAAWHGGSTMDTLVSLGVIASMGWSLWALLFGGAGALDYRMAMTGVHELGMPGMAPHVYFESAAMIVTFLLLGRWLEARSRRSAGDALRALLDLGASEAYLLRRADGTEVNATIPASELHVGDVFAVKPGEKIPADGVVTAGASAVNAALLTGESLPVEVTEGDSVTGATINTYGRLEVQATRVGEETTLAQMGRLLTEAQTGKAPVQRLADRISAVFVPGVLLIALADLIVRVVIGDPLEMALTSAITVLVVACPCALGLATPTALLVGSGAASKRGILIRGPEVLENAHRTTMAVLDKTGTLTQGQMAVTAVTTVTDPGAVTSAGDVADPSAVADSDAANNATSGRERAGLLQLAAAVEASSEHPIARAIVQAAAEKNAEAGAVQQFAVADFRALPGKGVHAIVQSAPAKLAMPVSASSAPAGESAKPVGESAAPENAGAASTARLQLSDALVRVGTLEWLESEGVPIPAPARTAVTQANTQGATAVTVAANAQVLGVIAVADTLRPESAAAIQELQQLGVQAIMISGDTQAAANAVAAQLGIAARGDALPEGKVAAVQELQNKGEVVTMVGDGVNDAAALAAADLSIAMGAGTDVAKAAADITIVNSDPRLIPAALRISKRTLRIVKQNLAWAFGYNVIAIPLALAGIIAPGLAAAAMASSSVIVVGNSLRLRGAR